MANPFDQFDTQNPFDQFDAIPTPKKLGIKGAGFDAAMNYSPVNNLAGFVRGAGSVGSTLLSPIDIAKDAIAGTSGRNDARRQAIDDALANLGADPKSTPYQTSKLVAEILGTAGIGQAAATVLGRVPTLAKNAPALLEAIGSGGMSAAGEKGLYGAAVRTAGGAVNGLLTAGGIDPADGKTGMMIGGAFPAAVQVAGKAGGALGSIFPSTPKLNPTKLQTAQESIDAGYKIPPSMIDPSLKNRIIESTSGKHATAQMFSIRNQAVSEDLTRKYLGLANDAPLTFDTTKAYRNAKYQAGYEPLKSVGPMKAGTEFNQELDKIVQQYTGKGTIPASERKDIKELVDSQKTQGFDSADAVDAIRILRENADELFRKGDNALAKATKGIAKAYEDAIDRSLASTGQTDLLTAYREARRDIARSFTVDKGIREGSGTLDARRFARELQNKKPITDELLTIAKFANTFDKAAQPPHLIGSPGVHNLTSMFSTGSGAAGGAAGAYLGGPAGAAIGSAIGASYPYVVPPLLRQRMMSKSFQQGLIDAQNAGPGLIGSSIDELLPYLYRSNPVAAGLLTDQ